MLRFMSLGCSCFFPQCKHLYIPKEFIISAPLLTTYLDKVHTYAAVTSDQGSSLEGEQPLRSPSYYCPLSSATVCSLNGTEIHNPAARIYIESTTRNGESYTVLWLGDYVVGLELLKHARLMRLPLSKSCNILDKVVLKWLTVCTPRYTLYGLINSWWKSARSEMTTTIVLELSTGVDCVQKAVVSNSCMEGAYKTNIWIWLCVQLVYLVSSDDGTNKCREPSRS
jgi:hypothetical protein